MLIIKIYRASVHQSIFSNVVKPVMRKMPVINRFYLLEASFCHVRFVHTAGDSSKVSRTDSSDDFGNVKTAKRISSVLMCSEDEGLDMIEKCPKLVKINTIYFKRRVDFLAGFNIDLCHVKKFPWLLTGDTKELDEKLGLLQRNSREDVTKVLPLLLFSVKKLKQILNKSGHGKLTLTDERIHLLSTSLQCGEQDACALLSKHPFLLGVPLVRLQAVLTLLEEAGVDKNDIMRDPWVLRYQPQQVKTRLDLARSVGMHKIKPWLARSTQNTFFTSLARYKASRELLGKDLSIVDFLARRLGLEDTAQVIEMSRTNSALLRLSPMKLGTIVDALMKEGYTQEDIVKSPRVLCHKKSTLLDKLALLKAVSRNEPKSLSVLCLSQRLFMKHVQRLKMRYALKKNEG